MSKTRYTHAVVASYDAGDVKRGDVISRHKSQAAADKAARGKQAQVKPIVYGHDATYVRAMGGVPGE